MPDSPAIAAATARLRAYLAAEPALCLPLREDLARFGPAAAVEAAIATLVAEGALARLNEVDALAPTRRSQRTGRPILRCSLQTIARAYAERKGARVMTTAEERAYASGASLQLPNGRYVGVDRVGLPSLRFGSSEVRFECELAPT